MIAAAVKIRLPKLYAKQREALFQNKRYGVVEATTKSGKTVGCMAWLLGCAIQTGKPNRNYWWIAPIFPQSKIAYRRTRRMLIKADPQKEFWSDNKTEMTITLANGAVLWFKGADEPDSLYGEDVYAAVVDEATRCKADAWYALRTTLTATRAPVRIIGNVKGRKNWAYQMARKAEAGSPDMSYAKITAYDAAEAGVLDPQEIEDAKRQLPEAVFNELYLAIPSDDGGNPFGLAAIRACISEMAAPPVAYWGVDLAKSQDWVVAIGLDNHGNVCAFQRWQSNWHNTSARLAAMIKHTPALVDSTGVGDPIVEGLKRKCPRVEGFNFGGMKFGSTKKQQLMEGLAYAIHNKTVRFPPDSQGRPLVSELESFEYEIKVIDGRVTSIRYSAPSGLHDDCVCALALAVMCRTYAPAPARLVVFRAGNGPEVDPFATGYDPLDDDRGWETY